MLNQNTIKKTHKLSKTINKKTHKLSKTINILTISKLKKIYKDIISNDKLKYKQTLLEFIFNYYLLLKGYRNIFQIMCTSKTLQEIKIYILNKYNIKYIIKSVYIYINILIIYNDKLININDIDMTFGKTFANQLGPFYVCARSNKYLNSSFSFYNKHRINISITIPTTQIKKKQNLIKIENKQVNIQNIELYGQMCKSINEEQINKVKQIAKDISIIIKQFDKKYSVTLKITDRLNLISNNKNIIFYY